MNKTPIITVFIHGTHPPQAALSIPLVHKFFYCPQELTPLSQLTDSHSKVMLSQLCEQDPIEFPKDHCYTFGWSGKLSFEARKTAAFTLYKKLGDLVKKYRKDGVDPTIKLLTHSHGGNVALSLKNSMDTYGNYANLTIDELILLACPVQTETAGNVTNELFKQVFAIHSHHDILQVIDPQGIHAFLESLTRFGLELTITHLKQLGPLFSQRHFPAAPTLKQLNVKYTHRDLFHIEFLLPMFTKALPTLIKKMKIYTPTEHTYPDDLVHIFMKEQSL